jgi:transcriptional regulator with XRE-family HTH domain
MPTAVTRTTFNARGFAAALDAERETRGLRWNEVAQQAGVSGSTLTRLGQGKRPDVDGLAKLLDWSGLDAAAFIRSGRPGSTASTLTRIVGELHGDPHLSEDSATALEQIVRAAYLQLAARDASEARRTDETTAIKEPLPAV